MVMQVDGRRRRHSAAERRAVLARFAASEVSVAAFCRSESISVGTLRRWQSLNDRDDTPRAAAPGFVELGALGGGGALTIELDLGGGLVLRVRRG
ncbi:MAG: transposase [Gammaproteobacteria bacterium]|nr:transposase [Gammaproteobacteria bacterium]